jgi:hypothetical protein
MVSHNQLNMLHCVRGTLEYTGIHLLCKGFKILAHSSQTLNQIQSEFLIFCFNTKSEPHNLLTSFSKGFFNSHLNKQQVLDL